MGIKILLLLYTKNRYSVVQNYSVVEKRAMKKLKAWMTLSTTTQKQTLARRAGVPYTYLYALLNGSRIASAELASKIEKSSIKLNSEEENELPLLKRGDISPVCANCEYYKRCKQ